MDLAQEVGYLKGMQEATQRELVSLNSEVRSVKTDIHDLRATTATKQDLAALHAVLSTKIDEAVTTIQGGSGVQQSLQNQTLWQAILKSPVTPTIITVVGMLFILVVLLSAQTGRSAASFVPYPSPATVPLPPGGSATSTTTVTVPADKP